jgi:hypothetical protein
LASVLVAAAPLADRLGRTLADLGPHLGRMGRNFSAAALALRANREAGDTTGEVGLPGAAVNDLASALGAEGLHLNLASNTIGLASLPNHLQNSHTAGGSLRVAHRAGHQPDIPPIYHDPPERLRAYWREHNDATADADEDTTRAALAAEHTGIWARTLRRIQVCRGSAAPDFVSPTQRVHSSRPNSATCWMQSGEPSSGLLEQRRAVLMQVSEGNLTRLTALRHTDTTTTEGSASIVSNIALALSRGHLSFVRSPQADMSDTSGDVDDRLQLRQTLASVRHALAQLPQVGEALVENQVSHTDHENIVPQAPARLRIPSAPPVPPTASISAQLAHRSATRPTNQLQGLAGIIAQANIGGTIRFQGSHDTDVGPTPQTVPRTRRDSLLGIHVRNTRVESEQSLARSRSGIFGSIAGGFRPTGHGCLLDQLQATLARFDESLPSE